MSKELAKGTRAALIAERDAQQEVARRASDAMELATATLERATVALAEAEQIKRDEWGRLRSLNGALTSLGWRENPDGKEWS